MRQPERNVMRSVKMKTSELLDIVRKNKVKHETDFAEAVQDYLVVVRKVTQTNSKIARTNAITAATAIDLTGLNFTQSKSIPAAPKSYADDYGRAIRMLELEVEPTVEIEDDVFNQLVLDEWAWKNQFAASSALYKTMI